MEGDKFSGKAQLSAQTSGTPQPHLFFFFSAIVCVFHESRPLFPPPIPPPPWYFPLSHAAPLLTACFCWVLDLELWSSAGFV